MKRLSIVILILFLFFVGGAIFTNIQSAINQGIALNTVRKIIVAENEYKGTHGTYTNLQELWKSELVETDYSAGTYRGFWYQMQWQKDSYKITAEPVRYGFNGYWGTGRFSVCVDQNGEPCS